MKNIYLKLNIIPRHILFALTSILLYIIFFLGYRLFFWAVFHVPDDPLPGDILLKAFYVGLKFDIRLALVIHLPFVFFAWIKPVHFIDTKTGRYLWGAYLVIVNLLIVLFYITDFGHYEYLESRLDATVLRFLYNIKESAQMVIESYPVLLILLLLTVSVISYIFAAKWITSKIQKAEPVPANKWKIISVTAVILIYLFGIYGKFSWYPLRWSDAFFSTHDFASAIALNPVLYFFDTYKNKDVKYDLPEVKKNYGLMTRYLGIKNESRGELDYTRIIDNPPKNRVDYNIILVFLESFTFYKTGIPGTPCWLLQKDEDR